jgi:hypothetical protein
VILGILSKMQDLDNAITRNLIIFGTTVNIIILDMGKNNIVYTAKKFFKISSPVTVVHMLILVFLAL